MDSSQPQQGFQERFQVFLDKFDLNPNSLAVALQDSNPVKYRRWLNGEVNPGYENLIQIALHYSVSLDWLMLGRGTLLPADETPTPTPVQPSAPAPVSADTTDWQTFYRDTDARYLRQTGTFEDLLQKYMQLVEVVSRMLPVPKI